jgi:transposase
MAETIMIGLDLAKNVFQAHGVDGSGQVVVRRQLRRAQMEKFFATQAPAIVGMEACAGAHYWARLAQRYGHEVRMMPPSYVKPYVKRNKTDGRDAEASCEAMQRPTMRFVAVKSEDQQAMLVLHRTRTLLVRQRTMLANALRGHLAEFGIVAAQGLQGLRGLIERMKTPSAAGVPQLARGALLVLAGQWEALDAQVRALELKIVRSVRESAAARRLMAVPCVGPIIASTMVASVGDARAFRSARGFAAWLGLTPRQRGTGGKPRSGPISKQGDRTLRTLLIVGASAKLRQELARGVSDPWLRDLLARRPKKVATVALAAKTARIIWAVLAKGEDYRARASVPAAA